jgi:hypothetical protein
MPWHCVSEVHVQAMPFIVWSITPSQLLSAPLHASVCGVCW